MKNAAGENAPYVMPIETPGYASMSAPEGLSDAIKVYTDAGLIVIVAGACGRNEGAPAGVTDFKAAIRYLRYNADVLPGDTDALFTFGMSGGGAQSALLGATGNSDLYEPYLKAIGAVEGVSDAVMGSMDWCPITNLNVADAAYEWEMGVSRNGLDEKTKRISDALSVAFANYINALGLRDEAGNALALEQSGDGLFHAGSYYDYLKSTIETSLNNFLADTSFPYNPTERRAELNSPMIARPNFGPMANRGRDANSENEQNEGAEAAENAAGASFEQMDDIQRTAASGALNLDGTYYTASAYIAALNANKVWVAYDKNSNSATITSVEDFMKAVKNASKSVGAFDDVNATQGENILFGYSDGNGAHFDAMMADVLKDIDGDLYAAYTADIAKTDALGNSVEWRMNMYNPMYYLSPAYDGYRRSVPAKYWRIRSGIFQGDTAISTELDYYLALVQYAKENAGSIAGVDFAAVWGLPHVEAERTGTPTENFINWVKECMKK